MSWTVTATPCPLPAPKDVLVAERLVRTGTACLALMDVGCVDAVWEDLLYDGFDHDHGDGGLMLNSASLGTHLEYDGDFPVRLFTTAEGMVVGLEVDLDPYGDDLDSLRRPADWSHEDGAEHGVDSRVGDHPDGWSEPVSVPLSAAVAVFGDPAGLPQADATGGLLEILFPAAGGTLRASTFTEAGRRRLLTVAWAG